MPSSDGVRSRPFRDHRQVVEGVIYRFRTGVAWRDLPASFGPWQTVWKRHHRFSTDGTWDKIHARLLAEAQAAGDIDWMVSVDSTINRAHQHATNASRVEEPPAVVRCATQGAEPSYKNPWEEPPDHAIGRSRGGLSTKIHQLVDGRGRPLVIALTPGQAGDSPMLQPLLAQLAVRRLGPGRPRTRPTALIGDKAYSSRATRTMLRERGITAVIPQPSDQVRHRARRGSAGGRPPAFDPITYKGRNVIERSFNDHKQWRGIATRYDRLATVYRGAVVLRAITMWLTT